LETIKKCPPEQRVVLRNVSWETYERLLTDHENSSVPHFTYDRGVLEIMSPLPEHEKYNRTIALAVEVLAEEMGIDVDDLGSTTFRRRDLQRGFEPDSCFYIQNEERIRGKARIDLTVDPPPDLVIDITSPSLNKFPIYARLGVPEVWRYDGERLDIFELESGEYVERAESIALSSLTSDVLSRFVREGLTLGRRDWMRKVREWARSRGG
jgi:Uma2 family endonuclease